MNALPEFRKTKHAIVTIYINRILSGHSGNSLLKLIEYDDHHYRAIFRSSYFVIQGDVSDITKSQWNTLKKKMKRHDKSVFIFKDYGKIDCASKLDGSTTPQDYDCLFIDFGFMY